MGIGPQRQDFQTAWIAFHSQPRHKDATLADLMLPWIDVEPVAEDNDEE